MATNTATQSLASESDQLNKLGVTAADELRKTVRRALGELFQNFLTQLPQALVVSAQNISTPSAREGFQDLAQSVAPNEKRWLDTFISQVDGHLIGDVKASQAAADVTTSAEESFVLANLELRAEEMHQSLIVQLDARLERVRQSVYIPIHVKALAPAGLCRALQDTADALQWPSSQRRLLFEKFDDLVVGDLRHLYQSLLDSLVRINAVVTRIQAAGTEAKAAPAKPGTPGTQATPTPPPAHEQFARPAPAPQAPQARTVAPPPLPKIPQPPPMMSSELLDSPNPGPAVTPMKAPQLKTGELPKLRLQFDPEKLDSKTSAMLATVASNDDGSVYSDGTLAAELLTISNKGNVTNLPTEQNAVPMQRMNMAGYFLSEAIADPLIPSDLKKQHESVRFPLVKSAIADETFFTAVTHPLRSLVNDLMLKSATSRVTGSSETRRIADLLQQVLVQFDLAPSFVREAMLTAQPLGAEQMKSFETMQRKQAQQRRESVIGEAKRIVAHELEQTTFSLSIPKEVTAFLNKNWGPLLMKRLIQSGMESASWKEGLEMMGSLIDQLETRQHDQPPPPDWKKLLQRMVQAMTGAGMAAEVVHKAINGLEAARKTPAFEV